MSMIVTHRALPPDLLEKRRNRVHHASWDSPAREGSGRTSRTNLREVDNNVEIQQQHTPHPIPQRGMKLLACRDIVIVQQPSCELKCTSFCLLFKLPKLLQNNKRKLDSETTEIIEMEVNGNPVDMKIFAKSDGTATLGIEPLSAVPENIPETNPSRSSPLKYLHARTSFRKALSDSGLKDSIEKSEAEQTPSPKNGSRQGSKRQLKVKESIPIGEALHDTDEFIDTLVVTVTPSSPQLMSLGFRFGANVITLRNGSCQQSISVKAFVWRYDTKLILMDIDDTVAQESGYPRKGWRWEHGIVDILQSASTSGYQILYLTTRSFKVAHQTRLYLDLLRMPSGPILLTPSRDSVENDKLQQLKDLTAMLAPPEYGIEETDTKQSSHHHFLTMLFSKPLTKAKEKKKGKKSAYQGPIVAGFGGVSSFYESIGVPADHIFTINRSGAMACNGSPITYSDLKKRATVLFPKSEVKLDLRLPNKVRTTSPTRR